MKDKISIIMGIYNCEKYLKESIDSIINQTYTNWELIMCDDGSKDNTLKIAKKYEKKYPNKIRVLVNDKNMGLNYTLNKCLDNATGEFIARQDGDDISLPYRLEKEIMFLKKNSNYSLVSSNMVFFDENGDWGRSHNCGEVKKENFIKGSPICHAPCMIRTEVLKTVNGYSVEKKLLRVEDYHLWFKLFIAGFKCYSLEECLYKMRDDNDAYKRRNLKNRINETRLKLWGFKQIGIPLRKYIWAFKPIIVYLIPKKIYIKLHYNNLKSDFDNKKIKIAHFVGSMNCGGTETMLINLFKNIDKNKFEFIFIENVAEECWYDNEIKKMGGRIIKIEPLKLKNIFKYIKKLKLLFKKEKIDVVHSHVFLHSGLVMLAAKKANVKVRISHSHSAMRKKDNNLLKKLLFRNLILNNSTNIVACSTEAGECLFGNKFTKIGKVIPNPIDFELIKNISQNEIKKLRKEYSKDSDEIIIGHVGRLVTIKNHDFLIELARRLSEKNFKFKMIFIGDGPEKESIKNKIKQKGLDEKIVLTGNIENKEVYKFMKIFNMLLLPSHYEGLPVTLIEAQALNVYSIVSNNVSKESDLGMGLIKFVSIDNISNWEDEILNYKNDVIKINKTTAINKYKREYIITEYEKIYTNK